MPSRRQFLAGAGTAGIAGLAGCLEGSNPYYAGQEAPETDSWAQPTFDELGSCYNPEPVGPREGVRERWSLDISLPSARPVVAGGLAFLPTASAVRAVDAATGEQQWRQSGGDSPMWPRSVLCHDGTLFVTLADDPALLALDAATGEPQWTFSPRGDGCYALLLEPDRPTLFTGDDDGNVYALDPETGERRWRRELFGTVTSLANAIPELVVGTEAGEVYGLWPEDGRGLWQRNLPGRIGALATANGGGPFVSLLGGPTVKLQSERAGATTWETDVWSADSFLVAGRSLFAAGDELVSLDRRDGERQWTGGSTTMCGPAGAGDTVYAASENEVAAYKFDGGLGLGGVRVDARRWSHRVEGRPEKGLVVADDAVFFLTEGGENESSTAYALESA
jgi:outer membrane protein assembly factor BamB